MAYVCLQGGWVGVAKCLWHQKKLPKWDLLKKKFLHSNKKYWSHMTFAWPMIKLDPFFSPHSYSIFFYPFGKKILNSRIKAFLVQLVYMYLRGSWQSSSSLFKQSPSFPEPSKSGSPTRILSIKNYTIKPYSLYIHFMPYIHIIYRLRILQQLPHQMVA